MNRLDYMINSRIAVCCADSLDVLTDEQGNRLASTPKVGTVGTVGEVMGGCLVLVLTALGLVRAAGAESPDGYFVFNEQICVKSAELAADGFLIPTLKNGETRSIAEGAFGVLEGARIAVAEQGLDTVLRAGAGAGLMPSALGLLRVFGPFGPCLRPLHGLVPQGAAAT